MNSQAIRFEVVTRAGRARLGRLSTPHGEVDTPAFMPVGTHATVKCLLPSQLREAGVQMLLANAYHLSLRPGEELIRSLGGLHRFMGWDGPILTDSGGYQVFSLAKICRIDDGGVEFQSPVDGARVSFTPERVMAIEEALGPDVAMPLDQPAGWPTTEESSRDSVRRTLDWAARSKRAHTRSDQAVFGIVQGSVFPEQREFCAKRLVEIDFPGYAVGGLCLGEGASRMAETLDATTPHLPEDRPRYLMGAGPPEDLLAAIERGIDLFDCVLPTRNGRTGQAFTSGGIVRLRNAVHRENPGPLDPECPCVACRRFSRAYLRHLFQADEVLGPSLVSLHNVTYYQTLMRGAREALREGTWAAFCDRALAPYAPEAGSGLAPGEARE